MTHDLRSGPALLLAAGEATTFFGHPLTLTLALPEGPYTVELRFEARPEVGDVAVDVDAGPHGITLTLFNFDTDEGRGSREPVLLGALGDDLLFLHFRAFRFGRSDDRTVHYSVFRVSRQAVGWVSPD
jgi:hypothetical protein